MKPVFTADEMRSCDRIAIEQYRIPGIVLMENAARGSADVIEKEFGAVAGRDLVIICGKGNNGGDGFAIARHCVNRGARVRCIALAPFDQIQGDARSNLDSLLQIKETEVRLSVTHCSTLAELERSLAPAPDLLVDAIFGTGFTSGVTGFAADAITAMNACGTPIIAIDIPSGVNADTGEVATKAIHANVTATMGALKRGLLLGDGRRCAGTVHVVDISMPNAVAGDASEATTFLVDANDVRRVIPRRPFDAHKYSCGKVFVLGGSVGFTGAAAMTAESALRSGAGMVHLGIPQSLNSILEEKLTEVITVPFAETDAQSFSLRDFEKIMEWIDASTVSVIGPGVSRTEETLELMRRIIAASTKPLVIDADALFALIGHGNLLKQMNAPSIITPHAGEFARLVNGSSREIEPRRIDHARAFAADFCTTLIYKGAPTVTATPNGAVFINGTGNPGMASAGMGDVLAGIVTGLWAQGLATDAAAYAAAFIHGLAGDIAATALGIHSLCATDVLQSLPDAFISLAREQSRA